MAEIEKNLFWPLENLSDIAFFTRFGGEIPQAKTSWEIMGLIKDRLGEEIKLCDVSPLAKVSDRAILEGNVIIEPCAQVMEYAKIVGPAFIGRNAIIGNYALVRESYIGDDSVVGYIVDVARSYVGNSCWFSRTHIADSFLAGEVNIGGGSVLASLRLDGGPVFTEVDGVKISTGMAKLGAIIGKKTQIGANVTVSPGVKIGRNCIVGPGVVVASDVGDNIYCKVNQELTFRNNLATYDSESRSEFRKRLVGR